MLLLSFWVATAIFPPIKGWIIVFLIGLCGICAFLSIIRYPPQSQYKSSIVLGVLIFASGILRIHEFRNNLYHSDLVDQAKYQQGILEVKQVLKNKGSSISLRCQRITFFNEEGEPKQLFLDKYLLVYIKTTSPIHFLPGDVIRVEGWLSAIKGPMNPNAFDARIYYNTLGIRHQLYCKAEHLTLEGEADFSLARLTAQWQSILTDLTRKNTSGQVAQLTNALMWGDRSDMDTEVRDAFADSGAMHVLSVSGMHVAIIYSMLFLILGPPGTGPFMHRLIRFCSYTFAIILYMGLTGACPAVVRAGLMIILYLFGKSMGWNTQIWNLLGFAAFVMLWINPYVWQNIGFQLSFLAMAGILLFANPIIRSLTFKNIILHRTWEIVVLSIAAQVFILPVLLRQFHQFPLTFIISSIVAIPAAYIVMAGDLLNTLLSFLGIDFLWAALDWTGKLFIKVMQWMSGLNPEMYFSLPSLGTFFLMTMAILFSLGLVFKWSPGQKTAWLCGIITFITLGCHRVRQWTARDLVIYHSTKGLMMDISLGGICYSILDCSLNPANIEFTSRGYRCHRDVIHVQHTCTTNELQNDDILFTNSHLIIAGGTFLLWKDGLSGNTNPKTTHLIIDECRGITELKEFILKNKSLSIVIPAHLDRKFIKAITTFLIENNILFHNIEDKGYFKKEL